MQFWLPCSNNDKPTKQRTINLRTNETRKTNKATNQSINQSTNRYLINQSTDSNRFLMNTVVIFNKGGWGRGSADRQVSQEMLGPSKTWPIWPSILHYVLFLTANNKQNLTCKRGVWGGGEGATLIAKHISNTNKHDHIAITLRIAIVANNYNSSNDSNSNSSNTSNDWCKITIRILAGGKRVGKSKRVCYESY